LNAEGFTTSADCLNNIGGSIQTSISGGTAPYEYAWSNSQSSAFLMDLLPGTFLLTVSDANGCSINESFNVENVSTLNISTSGSPSICAGDMVTLFTDTTITGDFQ
jgi:hypothetical protein